MTHCCLPDPGAADTTPRPWLPSSHPAPDRCHLPPTHHHNPTYRTSHHNPEFNPLHYHPHTCHHQYTPFTNYPQQQQQQQQNYSPPHRPQEGHHTPPPCCHHNPPSPFPSFVAPTHTQPLHPDLAQHPHYNHHQHQQDNQHNQTHHWHHGNPQVHHSALKNSNPHSSPSPKDHPYRKRRTPRGRWTTEYQANYGYFVPDLPCRCASPQDHGHSACPLNTSRLDSQSDVRNPHHYPYSPPHPAPYQQQEPNLGYIPPQHEAEEDPNVDVASISTSTPTESTSVSSTTTDTTSETNHIDASDDVPMHQPNRGTKRVARPTSSSATRTTRNQARDRKEQRRRPRVERKSTAQSKAAPCRCSTRRRDGTGVKQKENEKKRKNTSKEEYHKKRGGTKKKKEKNRKRKKGIDDDDINGFGPRAGQYQNKREENYQQQQQQQQYQQQDAPHGTNGYNKTMYNRDRNTTTVPMMDDAAGRVRWRWEPSPATPGRMAPPTCRERCCCACGTPCARRFVPGLKHGYNPRCYQHKGAAATQCIPRAGKETPAGDTCSDCFWFDDEGDEGNNDDVCCGCVTQGN